MGIDLNGAQLLIKEHKNGLLFGRMATLGRQGLHANRQALISVLRNSGYEISKTCVQRLLDPTSEYADDFLRLLGAQDIIAIDASAYEGANVVHDMNRPIPANLISVFDFVLDSGTLEHIFDIPAALHNAAQMVRPNGRFITLTMANNYCGHGFYQFSPELFYRFFCPNNGYEMESCVVWEDILGTRFYQVPDPDIVQARINLTSEFGTFMMVKAKRLGDVLRNFTPQQSDYVRTWERHSVAAPSSSVVAAPRFSVLAGFASVIKRIQILRSAVVIYKNKAIYRRMRIKRNDRHDLTPLQDIRVLS